jgi:hypothetical protein
MTMTSIRFVGALILLSALVSVRSEAAPFTASSVKDLADAVSEATKSNPKLRKQDDKRKNRVMRDFASSSSTTSRSLEDGGDDNAAADDYFSSNWNYDADYQNSDFGFELDTYSLKYTGCSTVETYSADQAADESETSVLISKRFATFRLCPTNTCSDNRYEGCSSNYGDYVVSLDQFLNAMVELNEDRVVGYCTYCEECAAIESFHKFYYETTAKKTAVLSTAQQAYNSWYNSKGYGNDDANNDEGAALAYYNAKKSSSSSSSNYNSNNNGNSYNSNSGSSSGFTQWSNSRASWNGGSSSSGSNSWSDMGSSQQNYGSWYGKQVVNGHYYNGAFVEEWGYFSGDGNFVSLEEGESIQWDEYLYGTYPDSWDEDWVESTADEVQSCNYQYSASCYDQYESCMRILENEDYMAYLDYVQSQNNNQNGGNSYNNGEMSSLADFLQCTQVDQEYIEQYQAYLEWQKAMASQYAQQQNGETYTEYEGDDAQNNGNNNNYNNYDNMQLYIGPHCGEDGHTITLGVYTDATCSTYTNKFSAKDILGVDVMKANTGGSMDLFPTKCISCETDVSAQDSYAVFVFIVTRIKPLTSFFSFSFNNRPVIHGTRMRRPRTTMKASALFARCCTNTAASATNTSALIATATMNIRCTSRKHKKITKTQCALSSRWFAPTLTTRRDRSPMALAISLAITDSGPEQDR